MRLARGNSGVRPSLAQIGHKSTRTADLVYGKPSNALLAAAVEKLPAVTIPPQAFPPIHDTRIFSPRTRRHQGSEATEETPIRRVAL